MLRTWEADAMFVWRNFVDDSGQQGINCAVFRNESQAQSSKLIQEADAIADAVWPNQRHYTYVNAQKSNQLILDTVLKKQGGKSVEKQQ